MNTRTVAWSIGLLMVSSLAGCGWERELRHSCVCTSFSGRTLARTRKAMPVETIDIVSEPADVEIPETPVVAANQKAEEVVLPLENALVPIPMLSQDRENAMASTIKELEDLLPKTKGQEKVAVLPEDDAKPAAEVLVSPGRITTVEAPDLENALNRLEGKKNVGGDAKEKTIPLQSTHISYGQADDYQQLTGQLQQWRKTWRLRYAAVGAEETYGGSVVLDGIGDTSKLRDGQHLRVRGRLIPPDNRHDSPRYVVQSIEVLD